jgi:transposase
MINELTAMLTAASNGSTEAINGLIELHRRIARSFKNRDN